jgi:hypothetical protein
MKKGYKTWFLEHIAREGVMAERGGRQSVDAIPAMIARI